MVAIFMGEFNLFIKCINISCLGSEIVIFWSSYGPKQGIPLHFSPTCCLYLLYVFLFMNSIKMFLFLITLRQLRNSYGLKQGTCFLFSHCLYLFYIFLFMKCIIFHVCQHVVSAHGAVTGLNREYLGIFLSFLVHM